MGPGPPAVAGHPRGPLREGANCPAMKTLEALSGELFVAAVAGVVIAVALVFHHRHEPER
jgi:hypothetical protein